MTDLCDAIGGEYETVQLLAVPVNDPGSQYLYPPRVRFELMEGDPSSYDAAADFLNFSNVDRSELDYPVVLWMPPPQTEPRLYYQ